MNTKKCTTCGGEHSGAHRSICKACMSIRTRLYYAKNREKCLAANKKHRANNPEYYKDRDRKNHLAKYGIDTVIYQLILDKQKGCCAICKTNKPNGPGGKVFMVDHCHDSKKVRGLLCCRCNFILGYAKDDLGILKSTIKYLKKSRES